MLAMSPRLVLALALTPVFAAASAHAQAPGDGGGDYYGPSATPPQQNLVAPVVAAPMFVPRWSIAASVGSISLANDATPDAPTTDFSIGQLAVRYRGWNHLELELSLAGGNQQLPDNQGEGELKIAHVTFAARYRFNALQHFNWWLMAGIGGTTVAPKNASDEQVKMAQRGHGLLGIGAEYRWTKFALQAEAKGIAIGATDDEQALADQTGMDAPSISAGSFTLGAAYYF